METTAPETIVNEVQLPPELDVIIAIAKKIESEYSSQFDVLFDAAMKFYYRSRFTEPIPVGVHFLE